MIFMDHALIPYVKRTTKIYSWGINENFPETAWPEEMAWNIW